MVILVVFNSFNVVKNLEKPDPVCAKCPHLTLLLTRAFNLVTRAFSFLIRRLELVTREFELVTRRF